MPLHKATEHKSCVHADVSTGVGGRAPDGHDENLSHVLKEGHGTSCVCLTFSHWELYVLSKQFYVLSSAFWDLHSELLPGWL